MIVRIQGEGQYELEDGNRDRLDQLDSELFAALDGGDAASFHAALQNVIRWVETNGAVVADDRVIPSQVILPPPDISLDEAKALFTDEGYLKPVEA